METQAAALVPQVRSVSSISEVKQMAEAAARSGLFPSIKSPEAAFTLMMLCQAEGLHPIQALRRFDIVQGRVGMKADAMLGEFQQRGGTVEWLQHDAEKCSAVFSAPGLSKPVTVTWTMDDAKRAGLAGKSGPWQQYPRQMLRARVISEGVRMAMPAVVVGLYAPEEVQDFARPTAVVEAIVEPPKAVTPAPVTSVEGPTTSAPASSPSEQPATPGEVKALNAAITMKLGIKDRGDKLAWISGMVGREVESSKDLTSAECQRLIEAARSGVIPREPGSDDE